MSKQPLFMVLDCDGEEHSRFYTLKESREYVANLAFALNCDRSEFTIGRIDAKTEEFIIVEPKPERLSRPSVISETPNIPVPIRGTNIDEILGRFSSGAS